MSVVDADVPAWDERFRRRALSGIITSMSAPTVSEQQILQALHDVPPARWAEVLTFLKNLQPRAAETSAVESALAQRVWTADELRRLPRDRQDAILREQANRLLASHGAPSAPWWSATELARLPADQRAIILEAAAAVAAAEYETNAELTAFDAFDESDLHDAYPDAGPETR